MRLARILVVAAMALPACGIAHAETQPPCPNDGYIPAMMVPDKHVAEAIYRAVGGTFALWNFKRYPIVEVEDEGDHWAVSQTDGIPSVRIAPAGKDGNETVTVTAGGGQLYMDINKCTGAISHAALNR